VIECICADGTSLKPFIIYKGENLSGSWFSANEPPPFGWCFSRSSKGWTSMKHGEEWLILDFEPATREKANGRMRLLICDGHDSHITAHFIHHCIDNKIILLYYPLIPLIYFNLSMSAYSNP
jgi:DDE superfamily endonuclease